VGKTNLKDIPKANRGSLRGDIYLVEKSISKMLEKEKFKDPTEAKALKEYTSQLKGATEFIPNFVKVALALTANGSGIQQDTVRSLLLAWALTLPVCMLLGSVTFGIGLLVTKVLGLS
jgi:phosphate/sulfate permease